MPTYIRVEFVKIKPFFHALSFQWSHLEQNCVPETGGSISKFITWMFLLLLTLPNLLKEKRKPIRLEDCNSRGLTWMTWKSLKSLVSYPYVNVRCILWLFFCLFGWLVGFCFFVLSSVSKYFTPVAIRTLASAKFSFHVISFHFHHGWR